MNVFAKKSVISEVGTLTKPNDKRVTVTLLSESEYNRFIETCANPYPPSEKALEIAKRLELITIASY